MIAAGFVPLVADGFARVDQAYLLEAREMQALSFAVHIPLVCFGIAFPTLVLVVEWLHLRTGDPLYRELAKRWSKAMLALFAVGVVTGTILSFEMGLLWPGFMSAFGDVFGLGFALEGISFFVEAIFIAIYVYGWDRLSPRLHFLSGIPVALAGITGSLMVLSVNAWMQNPSGFRLEGGGAVDVGPVAALFGNSYLWPEFIHMYLAAYMVVGFLIAGAYAWAWLRGRRSRYVTRALTVALTAAALAAPAQIVVGDWIARQVAEDQPTKLAAFEGLGETQRGAAIHIGGWYNEDTGEVEHGVPLPRLLSLLAHHDPDAEVQSLDAVPADERPPVNVVRITFQAMVAIGFFLALVGAIHLYRAARRRGLPSTPWFFRAVIAAGPLAVVALIAGWVTTEVGRQPWVVYGVMRTEEAVTGADGIAVGYATLVVVYTGLIAATAWVLRRLSRAPLKQEASDGTR
jgi:cytochrome bd ubiquinol oxidase subunit I